MVKEKKIMAYQWPGQRWRMVLAAGTLALLAIGLWVWQRCAPALPAGHPIPPISRAEQEVLEVAARRNNAPTIPGLEKGTPQLVPGLEEIEIPYGATLTEDLCTIVFSKPPAPRAGHILYIATRANVSSPFDAPQVIAGCVSVRSNYKPALSPDGLDLIFLERHDDPRLLHARRWSKSDPFERPVPWSVPEIRQMGDPLFMVRFVDPLRVLLSTNRPGSHGRFGFYLCERADVMSAFGPPKELMLTGNADGRLLLRPDLLVSYVGRDDGLYVHTRKSRERPFGEGACLVDATKSGPVTGPVWIDPGEDVAIYSSVGLGKDAEEPRHLWMIRF
jgi:hypothetical protein